MITRLKSCSWLLLVFTAFGCGGSAETCTAGETKLDDDGCNLCGCSNTGEWACTAMLCKPAPRPCGARAGDTCQADEYCAYQIGQQCGATDTESTCRPRPRICTESDEYKPVCGCDGKTHGNQCLAAFAGTGVLKAGPCESTPACEPGETKPADDGCNTCTCSKTGEWICTKNPCDPSPGKLCGGWAGPTCSAEEYCAYEPWAHCGEGDISARCRARPSMCTADDAPVCGCDKKTYPNACVAAWSGTGVRDVGPCATSQ